MQVFLDRLNDSLSTFGMRFTPSERKMLLQDWNGLKPNLVLGGEDRGGVDKFTRWSNIRRGTFANTVGSSGAS